MAKRRLKTSLNPFVFRAFDNPKCCAVAAAKSLNPFVFRAFDNPDQSAEGRYYAVLIPLFSGHSIIATAAATPETGVS